MARFDLKAYAKAGAQVRASEIGAELAAIYRAFPGLRGNAGSRVAIGIAPVRRRRKPMSAAQKRAVGIRMKKYWAERRKSKTA